MKKKILLLLAVIIVGVVTGCGKENEVKTVTCTIKESSYTNTTTLTSKNGEVGKLKISLAYDNAAMGVSSFNDLTDDQKEQIKTSMLTTLGFNDKTYEGFSINVYFDDQMKTDIEIDMETADKEALNKIGVSFDNVNKDFDAAVKSFKDMGYTCN